MFHLVTISEVMVDRGILQFLQPVSAGGEERVIQ